MKVEQVTIDKNNIMQHVNDETLYVVKMSRIGRTRKGKEPYPYGLSFKHFTSVYTIAEVMDLMNGECCIVRVTDDEE